MLAYFVFVILFFFASPAFSEETPTFDFYMTKGTLALDQKNYIQAIDDFNAALKDKPDDPSATLYIGIALRKIGNQQEAEKLLKKTVKLDPQSPRANLELGILYFEKGIYDEARDFFETVKIISPKTELAAVAEDYIRNIGRKEKAEAREKDWASGFQLQ